MNATTPRPRIALYSHDTVGLGHTRRQLALAHELARHHAGADLLLVTGNPEATLLPAPDRTDVVTLPTVTKAADGSYVPRRLGSDLESVVGLRSAILTAALTSFSPDLLIVDKVPQGLCGELLQSLEALRGRTRMVLGLREVLDDTATTRAEWLTGRTEDVIRDYYDEVWVYGDPSVFDPAKEYGWGTDTVAKTVQLGYLGRLTPAGSARQTPAGSARPHELPNRYVLCQMGGGADGLALAEAFLSASLPDGYEGVVLTGAYLPAHDRLRLESLAAAGGHRRVIGFTDQAEDWLLSASAVVSMGGYNSTVEILSGKVPALVVPRIHPRTEQLIRAQSLAATGALDVLVPNELTPERIGDWLAAVLNTPGPQPQPTPTPQTGHGSIPDRMLRARSALDLNGLQTLAHRTDNLIGVSHHAA
ncbi:MAG: glycosyltransferase family protein [Galactobacter sp.]|uniref:glycosyltransferase family protein n=1 Tax=Galactobacter sp. TaxID=2676125 RepID=UPI0025BBAB58|nr:glycosyltransferase [Galactobacter sp.]